MLRAYYYVPKKKMAPFWVMVEGEDEDEEDEGLG